MAQPSAVTGVAALTCCRYSRPCVVLPFAIHGMAKYALWLGWCAYWTCTCSRNNAIGQHHT